MRKSGRICSCLIAVAVAGCGSGTNDSASVSSESDGKGPRCRNGQQSPQPAKLLRQAQIPVGFFPTQTLWPLKSEWLVADCRRSTVVDAGADAAHPSDGLFGIVRNPGAHETRRMITVPGAGALKMTKAPLGRNVETWAQNRGNLQFTSKNGVTGTLHLRDDTVTIDR